MQTPPRVTSRFCACTNKNDCKEKYPDECPYTSKNGISYAVLPTEKKDKDEYECQDGGYDRPVDIRTCQTDGCIKSVCNGTGCIRTPTPSRKCARDPTVSPVRFVLDVAMDASPITRDPAVVSMDTTA